MWIPQRLDAAEVGKLRAVVVADELFPDAEQQALLDASGSNPVACSMASSDMCCQQLPIVACAP
jgi:hypothetical protein